MTVNHFRLQKERELRQIRVSCISLAVNYKNNVYPCYFTDNRDCFGCKAGYYCPGDGQQLICGNDLVTKYMFAYGSADNCTACPEGWVSVCLFVCVCVCVCVCLFVCLFVSLSAHWRNGYRQVIEQLINIRVFQCFICTCFKILKA